MHPCFRLLFGFNALNLWPSRINLFTVHCFISSDSYIIFFLCRLNCFRTNRFWLCNTNLLGSCIILSSLLCSLLWCFLYRLSCRLWCRVRCWSWCWFRCRCWTTMQWSICQKFVAMTYIYFILYTDRWYQKHPVLPE